MLDGVCYLVAGTDERTAHLLALEQPTVRPSPPDYSGAPRRMATPLEAPIRSAPASSSATASS